MLGDSPTFTEVANWEARVAGWVDQGGPVLGGTPSPIHTHANLARRVIIRCQKLVRALIVALIKSSTVPEFDRLRIGRRAAH